MFLFYVLLKVIKLRIIVFQKWFQFIYILGLNELFSIQNETF